MTFSGTEEPESRLENAEIVFVGLRHRGPRVPVGRLQGRGPQGQGPPDDEQRPGGRPGALRRARRGSTTAAGTTSTRWRRGTGAAGRDHHPHRRPRPATRGRSSRRRGRGEQLRAARSDEPTARPVKALGHRGRVAQRSRALGRPGPRRAAGRGRRGATSSPVPLGVTPRASPCRTRCAASRRPTSSAASRAAIRCSPGRRCSTPRTTITSAIKRDAKPGEDAIYNGALDNASGVAAMLAIAAGHEGAARRRPGGRVYFAAVGAEEQGLLGSEYLAAHPPVAARPHRRRTSTSTASTSSAGRATSR